jgi:hypothetical protein
VTIGSRDAARGEAGARELATRLAAGGAADIRGGDNAWAVRDADTVVISVPYAAHASTLRGIADALIGPLVIDITVPLAPPKVRQVHLPEGRAAALEAAAILGEGARLVAALHHISAVHLAEDHPIDSDVLVCGDARADRERAMALIADLGLRAIDAGALRNAIALESLTPVLIHINKHYKSPGAGLRITGLPSAGERD